MKVLLCTPYNSGPEYEQGGIVIWAQNIVNYYMSLITDVQLQVAPFDRKSKGNAMYEKNLLKRAWYGIIEYYGAIKNTYNQLKTCHFDVLHLCTSASISLFKDIVVLKMARCKGVKTIVHFHFGRIPEIQKKGNWEWRLLKKVVKLADAAVTMDMKSYNALRDYGFKNIHYLPNPLSNKIIQQIADERNSIKRTHNKLCFVGHVIPTKGVYELAKACKDIKGITLQIIGKVSNEVQCKMEEIAGDISWITFKGEIDHSLVIREMLSSDIFVLPTYTEGFPNVILEAMACGCAIVTTPVGAIPEMLAVESDEPCGLCCEPKNVEVLRQSILFFLDNPNKASDFGKRAQKRVNEMYSIEKVWEQLVGIWENEYSKS